MAGITYYNEEGLKKLKEELQHLISVERPAISRQIAEARDKGDLSENAEYHEAKDDQGMNEARIRELEELMKNAIIIDNKNNNSGINIGSTIKAEFNGQEKEFTIVGPAEADPASGLISNESPLGEAFIGKDVGDEVDVEAPVGIIKYKIKSVE